MRTILLVDDDPDVLAALQALLVHKGYRVVTANDGNRALALAEREAPDLVIVDMVMPRRSGMVVLETLKRPQRSGPPVIMISANEAPRQRQQAERLGVDDFIQKPFDSNRLLASVERLCSVHNVEPSAN
jgi:DNA-binding response OmpR family regulator